MAWAEAQALITSLFKIGPILLKPGVDFISFLRPIRALRPTFEKLFRGVWCALRRPPNLDKAISMICALRQTFMKSTPGFGAQTKRGSFVFYFPLMFVGYMVKKL